MQWLDMDIKGFLKGVWEFCRIVFVPQWGGKPCADAEGVDNPAGKPLGTVSPRREQ